METITDEEALAVLAIFAMNQVVANPHPCCPECCYPCDVLNRLANRPDGAGSLANILTHAPSDAVPDWAVDRDPRAELRRRWTRTECHQEQE